jgi:HTH-type transcriptional regulator/antitoxin HigA
MIGQRLIKTEDEYHVALARIEHLMDAEPDTPECDELELLSTLVELYEDEHYPINFPDPISAIQFRMEQLGFTPQNLMPFIGSRSRVSEILNHKRPLTLRMIRSLHQGLGIPAEILLQDVGRSRGVR